MPETIPMENQDGVYVPTERRMPTLEYPQFEFYDREYAPPVYQAPEFMGDVPELRNTYGQNDPWLQGEGPGPPQAVRDRIARGRADRETNAAMRMAGAGERRKIQSAVDRALAYGRKDERAIGETIANQGTALANTMTGAGRQAQREVGIGKDYAFRSNVINYNRQVEDVFGEYQNELGAARRNFGTLSGAFGVDLASAEKEAKLRHEGRVKELQMNFEAQLQQYLLSGVKTVTQIHTRR